MALMVAMVALVTVGVFFRYVVDASLSWYDEFASYLLVWLSFYGAVVATYRGRHISFETLAERARPSLRRAFGLASDVGSCLFQAVLFVYGIALVRAVGEETAVSIQQVRMVWIYSVLPISGGLMLLVSLSRLVLRLRGRELSASEAGPTAAASE